MSERRLSRRNFLNLAARGTAGGVASFLVAACTETILNHSDAVRRLNGLVTGSETVNPQLEALLDFYQKYGINIYNGAPFISYGNIQGCKLTENELLTTLEALKPELYKYPKDYFKKNSGTQISLIKNLKVWGGELASGTMMPQLIFGDSAIYLSTSVAEIPYIYYYIRETFHHEELHAADWANSLFINNWEGIQPCSCKVYDPNEQTDRPDWFVLSAGDKLPYGSTNTLEDRAVIAEILMMADDHRVLLKHIADLWETDLQAAIILQEKVDGIKADYFERSGGKMNAQYWQDLLNENITERYFQ